MGVSQGQFSQYYTTIAIWHHSGDDPQILRSFNTDLRPSCDATASTHINAPGFVEVTGWSNTLSNKNNCPKPKPIHLHLDKMSSEVAKMGLVTSSGWKQDVKYILFSRCIWSQRWIKAGKLTALIYFFLGPLTPKRSDSPIYTNNCTAVCFVGHCWFDCTHLSL